MNYALALRTAGMTDQALIESTAASFYLEQTGHVRYQARVLNKHCNGITWILAGWKRLTKISIGLIGYFASSEIAVRLHRWENTRARIYLAAA